MEWVKDRYVEMGEVVQVYKNLHEDKFSVRSKKTGLVCAYCETALLEGVRFHVSTSGRARVLERQVRSVHAYVEGRLVSLDQNLPLYTRTCVYYQPYKTATFVVEATGEPVGKVESAYVTNNRVYVLESIPLF